MRKILSLLSFLLLAVAVSAQKPVIEFDTDSHDFGEIQEKDGPVTFVFKYKNAGKTPLVLNNVQASCGCTTPEWTRTPIKPGADGSIKVTFDPANRPGTFNKTITVQSNAEKPTKTLRISGKVLQRPKTLEDEYPLLYDGLRLENSAMGFTKMTPDQTKTLELRVVNVSEGELTPRFINVPSHLTVVSDPATIKPNEKGVIRVTYDAAKKNDWGFVSDMIYVNFTDKRQFTNRISVSATIEEDFSKLSDKELKNAPVFSVDSKAYDFGTIPPTEKVSHDFVVTNEGKDKLIIRKVKASCGCTAVTPEKSVLEKGESTKIHVVFDPRGKSGRQNKTITVTTNDPKQSSVLLRISSNVSVPGSDVVK